jgi:hypothetical protein
MPFQIVHYEATPNPNAMKCWLDRPISDRPRSFLNPAMAAEDDLARRLFDAAPITTLLFNGEWMTVNKSPDAAWPAVKRAVERALAAAPEAARP